MHEKPHLVFIATRVPYPAVTGHYLRTLNILRGLGQHFSVHFFGFRDKNGSSAEYARADAALLEICASIHIEAVGAERSKGRLLVDLVTSVLSGQPFTAAKYRSRTMRGAIHAAMRKNAIAVAHADSLPSGQYLAKVSGPKLLTNHNVEHQRLYRYAAQRRLPFYRLALSVQGWLTRRYEREMVRAIGNCVVVSESDRAELARLAPTAKFFLVPNGTDASLPLLPPADPAGTTALWVGGMDDPFNREAVLHFASRILPLVREQIPTFEWRVIGRDPPPLLLSQARAPGSGVRVDGFVPTLREAYERCTIVVVPLLSGGGTKLKVLEAMAMGRAVVTTPVGAEGLDARDDVEMEIATTDEEFARKVSALLRDPQRRDRMAEAARVLAERDYAWESVNRRMHFAVQSVMDSYSQGK